MPHLSVPLSHASPWTSLFFLISLAGIPPLIEPAATSRVATAIAPRIASSHTLPPAPVHPRHYRRVIGNARPRSELYSAVVNVLRVDRVMCMRVDGGVIADR